MSFPSTRQSLVKHIVQGKGSNITQQRANHRNSFISRLKALRIKEIDKFRHISEAEIDYGCLLEIKKILSNRDPGELVDEHEVSKVLEDIEQEIAVFKAEQHEKELMQEVETTVNNLMSKCDICDTLIVEKGICETCLQVHFTSQF